MNIYFVVNIYSVCSLMFTIAKLDAPVKLLHYLSNVK
jgi:hypothetical protein